MVKPINLPDTLKKAISSCPDIVGIGPSAWPRIISAYFFPNFRIVSLHNCQDNEILAKNEVNIFSLKKAEPDLEIIPETPGRIINTEIAKAYFSKNKTPFYFLVYKSSVKLEEVCRKNHWKFIGNRKELMDIFENKKIFKEIIKSVGLEAIPGDSIPIENFTKELVVKYQKRFNQSNLVLQLAEMTYGGGSGTFFLNKIEDYDSFLNRLNYLNEIFEGKKKKLKYINVSPYIKGETCSISCCVTKFGTISGPIQTQIIDVPEVGSVIPGRSGSYAGTDWSYRHYSLNCQRQARCIAQKFGDYMYKSGYKGIFGLDLIVDEKERVWPVECNPRDTDAFPMISFLMMDTGSVPLDVFHNFEHLSADYKINVDELSQSYQTIPFNGSQIIIQNPYQFNTIARGGLKAGVYSYKNKKISYLREGFSIFDIYEDNEFLIVENVPKYWGRKIYSPSARIFRLIKRNGILNKQSVLNDETKDIIGQLYQYLKLTPIPEGITVENGLKSIYVGKISEIKNYENEKEINVINVIDKKSFNYYRPHKIAWRKILSKDRAIDEVKSKKMKTHILKDLNQLKNLGIEIITLPTLNLEQFNKWWILYKKIILNKKGGKVLIQKDWLNNKTLTGKKVGAILALKSGNIIGGDVFYQNGSQLMVGYGISEKINELSGSLMLMIDYFLLEYAIANNFKIISFGQDDNFYGRDLSVGLLSYKARLGFSPAPAIKAFWQTTFINYIPKDMDPVMFFCGKKGKLRLVIITKSGKINEINKYLPDSVDSYEVIKAADFIINSKKSIEKLISYSADQPPTSEPR